MPAGTGDNIPTVTTRTKQDGHRGHCGPFGSYSAPNGTR
jgi:hypothetical protein